MHHKKLYSDASDFLEILNQNEIEYIFEQFGVKNIQIKHEKIKLPFFMGSISTRKKDADI
jgi:hypothetical protein